MIKKSIRTTSIKVYLYKGYKITFDSAGSWSFDNDTARNVINLVLVIVHHLMFKNNFKNNFLVLDEGLTLGINGRFGSLEKKFSINFSKANTKFCLSLHYNADNS